MPSDQCICDTACGDDGRSFFCPAHGPDTAAAEDGRNDSERLSELREAVRRYLVSEYGTDFDQACRNYEADSGAARLADALKASDPATPRGPDNSVGQHTRYSHKNGWQVTVEVTEEQEKAITKRYPRSTVRDTLTKWAQAQVSRLAGDLAFDLAENTDAEPARENTEG